MELTSYLPVFLLLISTLDPSLCEISELNARWQTPEAVRDNADEYLEQYGYLSTPEIGESHDGEARRQAIKEFQRMARIPETGRVDAETLRWMQMPRCGMPDRMPMTVNITIQSRDRRRESGAPESYYVPGYKWNKTAITWHTANYSPDLPVISQRRALQAAFKYWSDVTPLTFREVTTPEADIKILFGAYEHGDGYQNSFDGESGTLAHAYFPMDSRTHFDESEHWTENTPVGSNLEIVAAHELGHALGLGHSNAQGALMRPFYQYSNPFSLGTDDIQAIQSLYGPREMPPRPTQSPPRPTDRPGRPTTTPRPADKPDMCSIRYDAVFQDASGSIYVLYRTWLYRLHFWSVYANYPVPARQVYEGVPTSVRAAVHSFRSGYTYFFKGTYVWRFAGTRLVERSRIDVEGYEAPHSALMAADGRIYLFRDRYYWLFDESSLSVETGLKRRITDRFPGLPANIDAAVRLNDGYVYIFKGRKYQKYDEASGRVETEYPRLTGPAWMGPACHPDGSYTPK